MSKNPNYLSVIQYAVLVSGIGNNERPIALRFLTGLNRNYNEISGDYSAPHVDLLDEAIVGCHVEDYYSLFGMTGGPGRIDLNVCGECGGGVCCRDNCLFCHALYMNIHTSLSMTNRHPLPPKAVSFLVENGLWQFKVDPSLAHAKTRCDWARCDNLRRYWLAEKQGSGLLQAA